jgi:hypothetical protein
MPADRNILIYIYIYWFTHVYLCLSACMDILRNEKININMHKFQKGGPFLCSVQTSFGAHLA